MHHVDNECFCMVGMVRVKNASEIILIVYLMFSADGHNDSFRLASRGKRDSRSTGCLLQAQWIIQ
jgi:hypothetical protein